MEGDGEKIRYHGSRSYDYDENDAKK